MAWVFPSPATGVVFKHSTGKHDSVLCGSDGTDPKPELRLGISCASPYDYLAWEGLVGSMMIESSAG
jgi:hypothetical protein